MAYYFTYGLFIFSSFLKFDDMLADPMGIDLPFEINGIPSYVAMMSV